MPLLPFSVVWFGVVLAVAQVAVLFWHLRRRYPSLPKRVPMRLRLDGRPGAPAPKAMLWVAPAIIAAVVVVLTAVTAAGGVPDEKRLTMLFVFVVLAEVAWLIEWVTDRLIELARGMTHRIAPTRLLLVVSPLLVTIGVMIAVEITQSL